MRLSNLILVLGMGGLAAGSAIAGCGGGGGGDTTGNTGGATTQGTGGSVPDCAPTDPVCTAVKSDCIALADNAGKSKFSLRMAQLTVKKPAGLTQLLVKKVIENGVLMNLEACNLTGGGTFNLILEFDTMAKKLRVGGAHPTDAPEKGYTFVDETVQGKTVTPVTMDIDIDAMGAFQPTAGIDTTLPIYLAAEDPQPGVLLPMHNATITGTLSADNNCIGKYNADTLDPEKNCLADDTHPTFTDAAELKGYITLEEADEVIVDSLKQSLCVVISGDTAKYGDGGDPIIKCKRTNGKIDFKGDWCDATNMPADATCFDATELEGALAASGVVLK